MLRTPGGASTRSKMHHVFGGAPYPQYISHAEDARVWVAKVDGGFSTYTDWICALGAVGIGHHRGGDVRHGALSLPWMWEEETAEKLLAALPQAPGWDQVRWVTTGSSLNSTDPQCEGNNSGATPRATCLHGAAR